MDTVTTPVDYEALSDADFLSQPMPSLGEESLAQSQEVPIEEPLDVNEPVETTESVDTVEPIEEEEEELQVEESTETSETVEPTETQETEEPESVDYAAFHAALTAPFKAGGQEVTLTDPADIIRLAQMGIGYSKRMEELNKDMPMLEAMRTAGVLTSDNVNMAIELLKGNPAAIKSLVQRHKVEIDPLDDEGEPTEYVADNHLPDQKQLSFRNALVELRSKDEGFVTQMNTDFDDASKQVMYENPQIMGMLYDNQQSGAYSAIMKEVNRLSIINHPSIAGMPILQAYKVVGDALYASDANSSVQSQPAPKAPVGTRTGTPAAKTEDKLPKGVTRPKGSTKVEAPVGDGDIDFSQYTDAQILEMENNFRF